MHLAPSLPGAEYPRLQCSLAPPRVAERRSLKGKEAGGYACARAKNAWPGLKQSGKIARGGLVKHLGEHGYAKAGAGGLFKHRRRGIPLTLVVDGFGIKYTKEEDAEHLAKCMREKRALKVGYEAKQRAGAQIGRAHV